jgi:O-antigen biosynthesis protein
VLLVGGPDDEPIAQRVLQKVRRKQLVFSLVGKTGLSGLPKILRSCDLFVGNDSGPKHLAAALGVPTIGIHSGPTDAAEWGPLGATAIGIRRRMTCSPCYLLKASDCHRKLACLQIGAGDVYRACRRMLALSRDMVSDRVAIASVGMGIIASNPGADIPSNPRKDGAAAAR